MLKGYEKGILEADDVRLKDPETADGVAFEAGIGIE